MEVFVFLYFLNDNDTSVSRGNNDILRVFF